MNTSSFHDLCVVEQYEEVAGEGSADAAMQVSASGVVFHPATGIDATPRRRKCRATLQKRILRAFVGRGQLENFEAKEMLGTNTAVSRWMPGCALNPTTVQALSGSRAIAPPTPLRWTGCAKREANWCTAAASSAANPPATSAVPKVDELHLTPLELIDRIAALVPPPRTHRHRYFGVLAPNSPLRAAVTALATPAQAAPRAGRVDQRGGVRAWCGTDEQRAAIPERAGAAQACSALPVGGADRPHLRGVPPLVSAVWRAYAHHRVHYAQR